jgi:hypothetical protein
MTTKTDRARECAEERMVSVSEAEIKQLYELVFGSWPFRDSPNREYMQNAIRAIQDVDNCPPLYHFLKWQKELTCLVCKKPIRAMKVYRCYDCQQPMHRSCCMKHCGVTDSDVLIRASLED